jgi:nicotinamide mononucleotide (NMN) deamidase PncC
MSSNSLVDKILEKGPLRIYFATTGGGAGLQNMLWRVPGISSVLVGAEFPYGTDALERFLGYQPDRYCSERTALAMAMESYSRAFQFEGHKAIGMGLTAVAATNEEHRGNHRVHVAWFSDHGSKVITYTLRKAVGEAARALDGAECDFLGLEAIAEAAGIHIGHTPYGINAEVKDASDLARELFFERPYFDRTGQKTSINPEVIEVIFPGAFNPPHVGHFGMAKGLRTNFNLDTTFHVTAETPHKPPLSVADMLQRAKMLEGYDRMFTRGDPLYLDKAKAFPDTGIVIGSDALERMLDPKWGIDPEVLGQEFDRLGTKFYVTERPASGQDARVGELVGAMSIPKGFRITVLGGRWDISSSQIRAGAIPPSSP